MAKRRKAPRVFDRQYRPVPGVPYAPLHGPTLDDLDDDAFGEYLDGLGDEEFGDRVSERQAPGWR